MKLTDVFERRAGVYIMRCIVNDKYYIGETSNMKRRMAQHNRPNTQIIRKAIEKYGKENFELEIYYLPDFDKESLLDLEEQMIVRYNSLVPNGYNISARGIDPTGIVQSEETKRKRVESNKGFKHTEECKQRMSSLKLGTKMSLEARNNMSLARSGENHHNFGKSCSEEERQRLAGLRKGIPNINKGKKLNLTPEQRQYLSDKAKCRTPEHRQKLADSVRGRKHTEETKLKMSLARKGKTRSPMSEETKLKISNAHKGKASPRKGKSVSEESRMKMSISRKGKPSLKKGIPMSEESKLKMSIAQKNRKRFPHSEETKQKIRNSNKQRRVLKLKLLNESDSSNEI